MSLPAEIIDMIAEKYVLSRGLDSLNEDFFNCTKVCRQWGRIFTYQLCKHFEVSFNGKLNLSSEANIVTTDYGERHLYWLIVNGIRALVHVKVDCKKRHQIEMEEFEGSKTTRRWITKLFLQSSMLMLKNSTNSFESLTKFLFSKADFYLYEELLTINAEKLSIIFEPICYVNATKKRGVCDGFSVAGAGNRTNNFSYTFRPIFRLLSRRTKIAEFTAYMCQLSSVDEEAGSLSWSDMIVRCVVACPSLLEIRFNFYVGEFTAAFNTNLVGFLKWVDVSILPALGSHTRMVLNVFFTKPINAPYFAKYAKGDDAVFHAEDGVAGIFFGGDRFILLFRGPGM